MKVKILYITIGIIILFNIILIGNILTDNNSFAGINTITQKEILRDSKTISVTDIESEITQLVKNYSASVVSIVVSKDLTIYRQDPWGFFQTPVENVKRKVGGGTAFFITKDGYLLTNKHVVADKSAQYTVITSDGSEFEAKVLAVDPLTDLAVVKIESSQDFKPFEFVTRDDPIHIGQFSIAIGNALAEFQNSVSFGVISGKNRNIEAGGQKLSGLLQTDAAINPGNSGGPLVNLEGKVMGINTAIVDGSQGIGFSIALDQSRIDFILESVKKYGEIKKPFIGINYILINSELQKSLGVHYDYGVYIFNEPNSVVKNSSADLAGIQPGDIILELDGKKLNQSNDLVGMIQNKIPGEVVELKVLKKSGVIEFIDLELGKIE